MSQIRTAGMGGFLGFDYGALPIILRAHKIPESEWIFILDKMALLAKVAGRYWNKDTK